MNLRCRVAIRFIHITLAVMLASSVAGQDRAEPESDEKALAAYADAANFQNNGASDLAIEAWHKYLKDFPDHDLAPKAAHYLGICYMQNAAPDYEAATKAFGLALRSPPIRFKGGESRQLRLVSVFNLRRRTQS